MLRWSIRVFVLVTWMGSILSLAPVDSAVDAPQQTIERPVTDTDPEDGAYDSSRIRCWDHDDCGRGECWEGQCAPAGHCVAYYSCV